MQSAMPQLVAFLETFRDSLQKIPEELGVPTL
jgi:hypothetical protein